MIKSASEYDDIFTFLNQFLHLGSEELRIAQTLLKFKEEKRTAKVSEIGKTTGIQEGKVYSALKRLQKKHLVRLASLPGQRPKRYESIDPDEMKRLIEKKVIGKASKLIKKYEKACKPGSSILRRPRIETLESRKRVYERAMEMVKVHPKDVFLISRRGAFYKWICTPELEITDYRDKISRDFGIILRKYLEGGGQIFAFISGQSPIEKVKGIEKAFKKKFKTRYLKKNYRGVTALMCNNKLILGWGPSFEHTTEGLYFEGRVISDFIREVWSVAFEEFNTTHRT